VEKAKFLQVGTKTASRRAKLDSSGSAIGAARMDPKEAYRAIPALLKKYIDGRSERSWAAIARRIDSIFAAVGTAMAALDKDDPFSSEVRQLVGSGKKLFFKPNLVQLPSLDPETHEPLLFGACLPWEFLAALMRWFHDKVGISYHQMAVGEAGTATPVTAYSFSQIWGVPKVTAQMVMEGKLAEHYGGWGFYFARKYLAERHPARHGDNPLAGYDESISGHCLPPGRVADKLLLYDLNQIDDARTNGREVAVPDGINYRTIILHKAIVGGDPNDPADRRDWPGCVLVNVAKLKIHLLELFTCAVKNLGVGLYPMQANESRQPGRVRWKYALPSLEIPMLKMRLPHSRWVVQYNEETLTPLVSREGDYVWQQTGGMEATMADIIQAVKGQGVKMLHVVDAVEATNINHCAPGATAVPEGFIFASNDVVAVDSLSARYLFSMLPQAEADGVRQKFQFKSDVIQKVPMPEIKGKDIVSRQGYDSPYSRYGALEHCEKRGLGQRLYHVEGKDLWQGGGLASRKQRLGRLKRGTFVELFTSTLYHTPNKPLWDLQATCLKYLELNDQLTGSDFKRRILEAFDENRDGVIDYMETGRGDSQVLNAYGMSLMTQKLDALLALELRFLIASTQLRRLRAEWSGRFRALGEGNLLAQALSMAFKLTNQKKEAPDPLFPGRKYGRGKWPSFQYAIQRQICSRVFGQQYPLSFDLGMSPYGCAFQYADRTCNEGRYCQPGERTGKEIDRYHADRKGGADELPFTFYVPAGLGLGSAMIPNVAETDDRDLIFTAKFNDGIVWKDLNKAKFKLK
jgi:hypothetical protein